MDIDPLKGKILLDESPAIASVRKLEAEVKRFRSGVDKELAAFKQQGNGLLVPSGLFDKMAEDAKRLKQVLAGGGGLKDFSNSLKLAMGGGAVAVIGIAAQKLEKFSETLAAHTQKVREGAENWADMGAAMLREVPIVGSLAKVFDSLAEAVTGAKAEEAREAEFAKQINDAMAYRTRLYQEQSTATKQWTKDLQALTDELELLKAGKNFGPNANIAAIENQQQLRRTVDAAREKYEKGAKLVDDAGDPGDLPKTEGLLKAAQIKLVSLKTELANAKAEHPDRTSNDGYDVFTVQSDEVTAATKALEDQNNEVQRLQGNLRTLTAIEQQQFEQMTEINDAAIAKFQLMNEDAAAIEKQKARVNDVAQSSAAGGAAVGDAIGNWAEKLGKDLEEVKKLTESVQNPLEKTNEDLKKWEGLRDAGLSDESVTRLQKKALQDLNKELGVDFSPDRRKNIAEDVVGRRVATEADQPLVKLSEQQLQVQRETLAAQQAIEKAMQTSDSVKISFQRI